MGWLKHFHYLHRVDKALVIRDSDWKDSALLESALHDRMRESGFDPAFPVHFYATRVKIETWLLADEQALVRVAETRGRRCSVSRVNKQLEDLMDPKVPFLAMLSEAGLPADDKVYEEIASVADLDRIAARCPYFVKFRQHVHAC